MVSQKQVESVNFHQWNHREKEMVIQQGIRYSTDMIAHVDQEADEIWDKFLNCDDNLEERLSTFKTLDNLCPDIFLLENQDWISILDISFPYNCD